MDLYLSVVPNKGLESHLRRRRTYFVPTDILDFKWGLPQTRLFLAHLSRAPTSTPSMAATMMPTTSPVLFVSIQNMDRDLKAAPPINTCQIHPPINQPSITYRSHMLF